MDIKNFMRPVYPSEILRDEIAEADISEGEMSKALYVSLKVLNEDTALRLDRSFGTTLELWINLQQTWELWCSEIGAGREIDKRVTPCQTAA